MTFTNEFPILGNRDTKRPSLAYEHQQQVLQKYLAMRANPLDWPTRDWDYEKDDWKTAA